MADRNDFSRFEFSKMRLVVAAGPTREWIDPVRFLTNASSGKTGWEIARNGLSRFAAVVYISGPCDAAYRTLDGATNVAVDTTADMAEAVLKALCKNSLLIMAAAPADYTPVAPAEQKIKKQPGETHRTIELRPTIDILKTAGENPPERCIRVGFAAETEHMKEHALEKLQRKNADFICGNEVYRDRSGFGEVQNTLHLFDRAGSETVLGPMAKDRLAESLLDELERRLR
ncbi:phosphopantothenoylcysteine decarboxylase [Leptonema illini]|uniref:DNA/pantothenate metabolism flavoprotein domain protein n=1 Tax=Leptonema illini DSM 21528 TaxID=929563 RepID=H2CGN7_9LEPT|nr:phosphopantothenoylcysteine decarboxylase [Leptonema illini]EHQ07954.1 DNA/pantothenate metabolism flavoprotein domain protein [Leptonema illini DSM 21528]